MLRYFKKKSKLIEEIKCLEKAIKKRNKKIDATNLLLDKAMVKIKAVNKGLTKLGQAGKMTAKHKKIVNEIKKELS